MNTEESFPQPPLIPAEELEQCRATGDFCPVLFEWYKYTGLVANFLARIALESPAVRRRKAAHYASLIGLLNRCCRLMLANVALSHEGLYGETTAIVDRCIFESAVKIVWLCQHASDEAFDRYIADGLKTELALKSQIEQKIAARDGRTLKIEERMLASIARYIAASEMTETQISGSKKLPDLASMIDALGSERLTYVVGQQIGSHHVHGTWPSLLTHYLEWEDGSFQPRDHDAETHVNQYVFVPMMVLAAGDAYCDWLMEAEDAGVFKSVIQSVRDEILAINKEVVGGDFTSDQDA
ncbi:MAG: DUF5677 domain-containing protein [Pseudomonadota bacterium]